jgi:hypothetical protein
MPIASKVKLTDICPARVATSFGPAPAAIHRATAVCRSVVSVLVRIA